MIVANPNVADVQVLNPTQLLLTGKTIGRTTLFLIFAGNKQRQYDLVVHAGPRCPRPSAPVSPELPFGARPSGRAGEPALLPA